MSEQSENDPTQEPGEKLVLNSPEEAKSAKDFALWAGVLMLAVLTIYSPAIRGKFIWDDDKHVERNAALRTPEGLDAIWFGLHTEPQYYPLTHTTYWIEYQLSPRTSAELDPMVFHITNVVLHAIAAVLLWFVLRKLNVPGAWLAAAIWALHPMQVETAAWISERKNVLAAVFFFASIWAYLEYEARGQRKTPRGNWYWTALGLFIAAMLSKTVACSMPAVMALIIWWKNGKITRRNWIELAPFFAIGLVLAAVTAHLEKTHVGAQGAEWAISPAQRILLAGRAIWFYAGKILVPYPLIFFYRKWDLDPGHALQWIFPLGVIAVIAALLALRNRIGRGPVVAALIFCGVLVPALGFVNIYPMRYSYVADHFQYLASPALIAAIVALLANVMGKPSGDATSEPSPAPYVLSAIVLVVLSVMTFVRAEVFMGNIPLWRDVIAKNPDSWIAHYNLGTELMFDAATPGGRDPKELAQQLDEATKHFQGTIRLKPDHDKAYNHWGHVLYLQGNIDAAVDKFNQALSINPNNWAAMVNLAQARMQKKQYADAEKLLHQAITLTSEKKAGASNGEKSDMHRFLAATLLALGHKDEALAEYQQALEIFPLNYSARMDYGKLLRAQGKLTEAATQFVRVLREAQLVDALVQIAELQTEVGKLEPAREHLELAVRLNPNAPGLREAVEAWRRKSDAATKPSTTRSTTTRSTTTRAASIPATVPAIRP